MKRSKQTKEKRQLEEKKLLEEGCTQREICEKLNVCLKTVNNDCKEIRSVEEIKTDSMVRDLAKVAENKILKNLRGFKEIYNSYVDIVGVTSLATEFRAVERRRATSFARRP